jgi:hypothetical protein
MDGLTVHLSGGLKNHTIEFIQHLEKTLDDALVTQGFSRTGSTKSDDVIIFNYRQFGVCL